MRALFAFWLLIALLAGCAQNPAPQNEGKTTAHPDEAPAPAPESPPGSSPAGQTEPEPAEPAPPLPAPPPPPSEASEFSGKTLESIAASGSPVECDITFTYQSKPAKAKLYLKGTAEMRFEETTSGLAQCDKTITVIRESRRYSGCEGKMVFPGCDWFRSDHSGGLPSQFRDLPLEDVDCRPWIYDKAKFATSGQSCSM